jgi:putative membrane protein
MRILVRLVISAAALAVAAWLLEGITVGPGSTGGRTLTLLGVAVVFGLVNAIIRPVVRLLTAPLFILTLGLFTFVVNALMLLLTSWVCDRLDLPFRVHGFWTAVGGSVIVSVVSFLLNLLVRDRGERR